MKWLDLRYHTGISLEGPRKTPRKTCKNFQPQIPNNFCGPIHSIKHLPLSLLSVSMGSNTVYQTKWSIWNKNQMMSLFQFYLYIAGSLHVSGPQAHPQESLHSCSHNHWFSVCIALAVCSRPEQYRHWTNGCVNSCVKTPEDGPVGPKHVEIRQYINKIEIVTSVGFYSIC